MTEDIQEAADHVEQIPTAAGDVPFARGECPEYAHIDELGVVATKTDSEPASVDASVIQINLEAITGSPATTSTPAEGQTDTITPNIAADEDLGESTSPVTSWLDTITSAENPVVEKREIPNIAYNDIDFDETHYYRLRAGIISTLPIDKYVSSGNGEKLVAVLVEGGVHDGATFPVRSEGVSVRYESVGNNRHISRLYTFKKMLPGDELGSFRCAVPSLVAFVAGEPVMSYDLSKFDQAAFNDEFISIGTIDDAAFAQGIVSWTGQTLMLNPAHTDRPMIAFKVGGDFVASIVLQHGPAEVVGNNGVGVAELIAAAILALKSRASTPSELDDAGVTAVMAKLQEAHDAMDLLNKPANADVDEEEGLNED